MFGSAVAVVGFPLPLLLYLRLIQPFPLSFVAEAPGAAPAHIPRTHPLQWLKQERELPLPPHTLLLALVRLAGAQVAPTVVGTCGPGTWWTCRCWVPGGSPPWSWNREARSAGNVEAKRCSVWAQGLFVVCFPRPGDGFQGGKGAWGTAGTFSAPSAGDTAPDTRPLGKQEHRADLISLQPLAHTSVHASCSLCSPFLPRSSLSVMLHRRAVTSELTQGEGSTVQGSGRASISLPGADLQGCIPLVLCSHH